MGVLIKLNICSLYKEKPDTGWTLRTFNLNLLSNTNWNVVNNDNDMVFKIFQCGPYFTLKKKLVVLSCVFLFCFLSSFVLSRVRNIARVSWLSMLDCPICFLSSLFKYPIYILFLITQFVHENKTILITKAKYKKNQCKYNIKEKRKPWKRQKRKQTKKIYLKHQDKV